LAHRQNDDLRVDGMTALSVTRQGDQTAPNSTISAPKEVTVRQAKVVYLDRRYVLVNDEPRGPSTRRVSDVAYDFALGVSTRPAVCFAGGFQ
jgi:hypothetical protein